ncbi:LuxR family two component transcriptional regulator [Amycolatopsis methanolica 239]|uniref:LuxR family two component transcriptional regulator n=1 Tax=Amycolatopsis methanolica 239 TaxID=1068978 RepID=A0A076N0R9_AMYME|nr:LuxR family two component transcriptional regulator [Amycolatopsis methanolica 239]AIJ26443.1 LuxR family two component transcriptional regulator [Amycolatopsis methanolica 239]
MTAALADDDRSRYTGLQIHPDAVPLVMGVLSSYGIDVKRIPDGPARQRRYVTGGPGKVSGRPVRAPERPALSETNPPAVLAGLTEREVEVLHGMSQGLTNADIGRELHISEDTVKTHARRMFHKLGARDRAHAVFLACQRNILDTTGGPQ